MSWMRRIVGPRAERSDLSKGALEDCCGARKKRRLNREEKVRILVEWGGRTIGEKNVLRLWATTKTRGRGLLRKGKMASAAVLCKENKAFPLHLFKAKPLDPRDQSFFMDAQTTKSSNRIRAEKMKA